MHLVGLSTHSYSDINAFIRAALWMFLYQNQQTGAIYAPKHAHETNRLQIIPLFTALLTLSQFPSFHRILQTDTGAELKVTVCLCVCVHIITNRAPKAVDTVTDLEQCVSLQSLKALKRKLRLFYSK